LIAICYNTALSDKSESSYAITALVQGEQVAAGYGWGGAVNLLNRSKRVKADHDERVARVENGAVQWNLHTVVVNAFDLHNRAPV